MLVLFLLMECLLWYYSIGRICYPVKRNESLR